jgi:hypothetical protein
MPACSPTISVLNPARPETSCSRDKLQGLGTCDGAISDYIKLTDLEYSVVLSEVPSYIGQSVLQRQYRG